MEVVGLVASIITLIGAASLTGSTIQRAWNLRGSPIYLVTALNEVNDFKALLEFIRAGLSDLDDNVQDHVQFEMERLLDKASERLHAFDEYLKTKVLRDGEKLAPNANLKLRKSAKLREVIGEGQAQVNALQQALGSVKMNLMLAIGASQFKRPPKIPMSIQNITLVNPQDTPIPSSIQWDQSPVTCLEEIASSVSGSVSPSSSVSLSSSVSPSSVSPSSSVSKRNGSDTQQPSLRTMSYVRIETNVLRGKCMRQCPCQCHIPMQGNTPQWLKGIIGTAFFRFTGTPLLNYRACDFTKCRIRQHEVGSARFQYLFPTWLLPLGIEFASSWCSLGGVGGTWSLRMPRTITDVPVCNLFYWYAQHGSVLEFRQVMDEHRVRAFDVFPREPFTLMDIAFGLQREDICLMLLENGADIEVVESNGFTMAQAFWQENLSHHVFENFRRHPAIEDAQNNLGLSPAHKISMYGTGKQLAHHIALDPKCITLRDCYGFTPLHWAARFNPEATKVLLEFGADVNAVCKLGRSVLSWAVRSRSSHICKMLLDAGADISIIDNSGDDAIFRAFGSNPPKDMVELLLEASSKLHHQHKNAYGTTYLTAAIFRGSAEVCESVIEYTADIDVPDDTGLSAMSYALAKNNHAAIKLLLDRGADVTRLNFNRRGNSIIDFVAIYGDIETMRILQHAQLEGLPMNADDVKNYWYWFEQRDRKFLGRRAPLGEEIKAFQAFLDSIVPCDPPASTPKPQTLHLPGAFGLSRDSSDAEDSSCSDVDSDIDSSAYESCDEEAELHEPDRHVSGEP